MRLIGLDEDRGPLYEVILSNRGHARLVELTDSATPGVPTWRESRDIGADKVAVETHNPGWFVALEKQVQDAGR